MLIQAFERRVLTYNPANPPAFQVEMGNIGLHYYDWRYNNIGACPQFTPRSRPPPPVPRHPVASSTRTATPVPPTATATPGTPGATRPPLPLTGKIVWVSNRAVQADVWIMNADGTTPTNLTQALDGDNYDPVLLARRQQDRLRRDPGWQPGNLCDERRRHRRRPA